MQLRVAVIVAAVIGASVLVGSAAFTSGTVERTTTVDVVGDGAALTGLAPGDSGVVDYGSNDQLAIDFGQVTNADGVNANATYTVGDDANANTTYAFNMTNNDDIDHSYTLSYVFDTAPASNSGVTFTVYDDTGTQIAEATDASDSNSFTLTSTETAYVVLTVDSTDSTTNDDLSGTLTISAS